VNALDNIKKKDNQHFDKIKKKDTNWIRVATPHRQCPTWIDSVQKKPASSPSQPALHRWLRLLVAHKVVS
jgi:hypothetical protein